MRSSRPQVLERPRDADRVGNSLALIADFIRLKAACVAEHVTCYGADEVNVLLAGMACRVDMIGELQGVRSTERKDASLDLGEHLRKMCAAMQPLVSLIAPTELYCEPGPNCSVPAEDVVAIALIVSEMVTNAAKYAHPAGVPGRIHVSCRLDGHRIIVGVSDDGVGLPENFDIFRGGGLGFNMVRALATQLDALPVFESDTLGLRFLLLLPQRKQASS